MLIDSCICSYNGENYIAEQLNSIVNQTLKVDEIILSDDKSTDKTIEIAENILKNSGIDYKILINEKNQGVTKNFENSCSHATGDIIFFILLQNISKVFLKHFSSRFCDFITSFIMPISIIPHSITTVNILIVWWQHIISFFSILKMVLMVCFLLRQ